MSNCNLPPQRNRPGRPPKSGLNYDNARDALLQCGMEILTEKGFNHTGIDQILKQVNVPKGSFYHYFKNKEAYGCAVIDLYSEYFIKKLQKYLYDPKLPALARLQAFMESAMRGMQRYDYKRGCLVGNMAQEMSSSNENYRAKLEGVFDQWRKIVADCLKQAKQEGTISQASDCDKLANFFWIGWEGAVMYSKLSRNHQPMELFAEQFLVLLKK